MIGGTKNENVSAEDIQACLACFYPNSSTAAVCVNCGVTVDLVDGVDPVRTLVAEGRVYRKATELATNRLILVGVWIIFMPILLVSSVQAVTLLFTGVSGGGIAFITFWVLVAVSVFSFEMLRKVTANFLQRATAAD